MRQNPFHIPKKFAEFSKPVLIICMGHLSAKTYHGEERFIYEGEEIHTRATDFEYSDKENFGYAPTGAAAVSGNEKHNKEHYQAVYVNYFVKRLQILDHEENYSRIFIFLPSDIKGIVREKMHPDLATKIEYIEGNFVKHPLQDLLSFLTLS